MLYVIGTGCRYCSKKCITNDKSKSNIWYFFSLWKSGALFKSEIENSVKLTALFCLRFMGTEVWTPQKRILKFWIM